MDDEQSTSTVDRRLYLSGLGTGVAAGLAGCGAQQDTGTTPTSTATSTESDTSSEDTPTDAELETGGKPTLGIDTAPDTLNILTSRSSYAFTIIDRLYTRGTRTHPETGEVIPWGFRDWELNVDNIGTGSPAIVAEMRDDLVFSDGEPVTAEDAKFFVEFVQEQQPGGTFAASQFNAVESIEVDSPDGTTVNYYLSEKDNAWSTNLLGFPFLPKHIWENVDDVGSYNPRQQENGLVGSGPMVLENFSWENWYELSMRDPEVIPFNDLDYTEWLHPDGPFLDGLRVEVFGSQNAVQQALETEAIDLTLSAVDVSTAVEARQRDWVVHQSNSDGWNHFTWNRRRVPLDDNAFGQFLVKVFDGAYNVEELFRGIGAIEGTYASPVAFGDWRPDPPGEIDEYEGIEIPDLEFPGESGTFQLDEAAIQEARDFLLNHPDAKHDYSLGEATSSTVSSPDGQAIYVNGEPLTEAHTDNEGNPGQGPLEHSFNPPQTDLNEARISQQWIGALKTIGVPMEPQIQSFNSQIPKVFNNENFDIFAIGWVGQNIVHDYFQQFFSSRGADLDSTEDTLRFNAGAYTGADDRIFEQASLMSLEERRPIVKEILAKMWHDAPTLVTEYPILLQPTTPAFTGYVTIIGGVANNHSFLNLRPSG